MNPLQFLGLCDYLSCRRWFYCRADVSTHLSFSPVGVSPLFLLSPFILFSCTLFFFFLFYIPLSLPSVCSAEFANSHADLSLDRWSRAQSVCSHPAPNKTSRCLQICCSHTIVGTRNIPTGGGGEADRGRHFSLLPENKNNSSQHE